MSKVIKCDMTAPCLRRMLLYFRAGLAATACNDPIWSRARRRCRVPKVAHSLAVGEAGQARIEDGLRFGKRISGR